MIDTIAPTLTTIINIACEKQGFVGLKVRVFAVTLTALRLLNSRAHLKTVMKPVYFHKLQKHAFATSSDVFTWLSEVHKCMLEAGSRVHQTNNYKTNVFIIMSTNTPPQHQAICLHNVCNFQDACSKGVIVGALRGHLGRLGHPCRSYIPPRALFLSLVWSEMTQWNANSPRYPAKSKPWRSQATSKATATNKSKGWAKICQPFFPARRNARSALNMFWFASK